MYSDVRFTLRTLRRNRGFALVTILTLALGLGSAAAIFSVTHWILFSADQFPNDVVLIGGSSRRAPSTPIRYEFMARAYEEQTDVMEEFARASYQHGNVVVDGQPVGTSCLGVAPNLFSMLGVAPRLGRGFMPGENEPGANHVAILSDRFWRRHLGGREDALGQTIVLGEDVCTVVGVLRRGQFLPPYFHTDVYRPLTYAVDPDQPWRANFFVLGRLRPGVTIAQATQALTAVPVETPAMMRQQLEDDRPVLSTMADLKSSFRVENFWVMLAAVGLLYAIACLNASNLMLVRMLGLQRELSIRLALGGGRWRVIRLLVLEAMTLALTAAIAGAVVANWVFPLLLAAAGNASFLTDLTHWKLEWRTLGVLGALTLLTSLLIVVVPAARVWRTSLSARLKEGGTTLGESPGMARLRGGFVVAQSALAVILLTGAGLMLQTFHHFAQVDLGFDPTRRAKVNFGIWPAHFPREWESVLLRLRAVQTELLRLPGVDAVGFGGDILLPGYAFEGLEVVGPGGSPLRVVLSAFNIGFQNAAGISLTRGRWLEQTRGNEIMVNEAFARAFWPAQDPVGQFVRPTSNNPDAGPDWQGWGVVGVVRDVRVSMRQAARPAVYFPEGWGPQGMTTFVIHLTRDYEEAIAGEIRRRLYAYDPRLVVSQILSIDALRENQLWAERMAKAVLTVLAGIALLLTVVGVFSVLAYTVDRRTGEFGVRLALGATPTHLVRLVLGRGIALTILGLVLGTGGSLALARFLRHLLFETSTHPPWVLIGVSSVVLLTSLAACILPARRAARTDVSCLLRSE